MNNTGHLEINDINMTPLELHVGSDGKLYGFYRRDDTGESRYIELHEKVLKDFVKEIFKK